MCLNLTVVVQESLIVLTIQEVFASSAINKIILELSKTRGRLIINIKISRKKQYIQSKHLKIRSYKYTINCNAQNLNKFVI